jgi:type IV secretory pathway VirB10-like protein
MNQPEATPAANSSGEESDLMVQPIPKVTRFRRNLVYPIIGIAILAAAVTFTYGLMHNNHGSLAGAGKPRESATTPTPDVSDKFPKTYADVPGLVKQPNAPPTPGTDGVGQNNTSASSGKAQKTNQPSEQQLARSSSVFFRQDAASSAPVRASPVVATVPSSTPSDNGKPQSVYGDQPLPAEAQGGLAEQKNAFLSSAATSKDYLSQPLQHPRSRFEIKAGSEISAALVTAINSDLPGEVIAQVTENVFDTVSGRYLLVPQGSRVIGKYDSLISYGQDRALVVWNRLILPNGTSIDLEAMRGTDETGAAGLEDETNHHRWAFAGALAVSTVMSFGPSVAQAFAQKATSGSNTNIYTQSSTTLGTQSSQIGENMLNRELNRPNTITIRQGWPLRILLDKDMVMEAYPNG